MVQIALAPCSPFSVTTSLMKKTAELAGKLDVRLHTHLAETEDENRFCEQLYRCRPLDYLKTAAGSTTRTWLAHGVHFNESEMSGSARRGPRSPTARAATRCWPPAAARSATWKQAGVGVGLGVDGSASNDESNLMQEVRAAFLLQRLRYGVTKVSHTRRAALGHQRLRGLRRPSRAWRDRGRQGRRSRAVQARRAALLRTRRSARRRWCCAVRIGPIG